MGLALTTCLERTRYNLRQGQPINEVAVLVPTADLCSAPGTDLASDRCEKTLPNVIIPEILNAGFDFGDPDAIDRVGFPDRVLVLPKVERFPWITQPKTQKYVQQGAIEVTMCRAHVNAAAA